MHQEMKFQAPYLLQLGELVLHDSVEPVVEDLLHGGPHLWGGGVAEEVLEVLGLPLEHDVPLVDVFAAVGVGADEL